MQGTRVCLLVGLVAGNVDCAPLSRRAPRETYIGRSHAFPGRSRPSGIRERVVAGRRSGVHRANNLSDARAARPARRRKDARERRARCWTRRPAAHDRGGLVRAPRSDRHESAALVCRRNPRHAAHNGCRAARPCEEIARAPVRHAALRSETRYEHTEHRCEMVVMGAALAEPASHRRSIHFRAVGYVETVCVPDRHAAQRCPSGISVGVLVCGRLGNLRRGLASGRAAHAARCLPARRRNGGSVLPVLRTDLVLDRGKQWGGGGAVCLPVALLLRCRPRTMESRCSAGEEEAPMRKLVAAEYLTLDGVTQDPGPSGDFEKRGWTVPYWNDELSKSQSDLLFASDALLLGRVTYEEFVAAWPLRSGDPFTDRMNSLPKFVASKTLKGPLKWSATLLKGDVADEVAKLKKQSGQNLLIYGSGALVNTLMKRNLIDIYRLMLYPVVLQSGERFFRDGISTTTLKLSDVKTTTAGVVVLTYLPGAKDHG